MSNLVCSWCDAEFETLPETTKFISITGRGRAKGHLVVIDRRAHFLRRNNPTLLGLQPPVSEVEDCEAAEYDPTPITEIEEAA